MSLRLVNKDWIKLSQLVIKTIKKRFSFEFNSSSPCSLFSENKRYFNSYMINNIQKLILFSSITSTVQALFQGQIKDQNRLDFQGNSAFSPPIQSTIAHNTVQHSKVIGSVLHCTVYSSKSPNIGLKCDISGVYSVQSSIVEFRVLSKYFCIHNPTRTYS